MRKWQAEHDYRLLKERWAYEECRIAIRFACEGHDAAGDWYRAYGKENWAFDADGPMRERHASMNDLAIAHDQRLLHRDVSGPRPADHPLPSERGL